MKVTCMELYTFPWKQMIIFGLVGRDYTACLCGFHSSTGKGVSSLTRQLFFSPSLWLLQAKQMILVIQSLPRQHNRGENSLSPRELIHWEWQWGQTQINIKCRYFSRCFEKFFWCNVPTTEEDVWLNTLKYSTFSKLVFHWHFRRPLVL